MVRKGWSDDLPDTIRATALLFVTPFHGLITSCVRRFRFEFGRSTRRGETDSMKGTVGDRESHEPEAGIGPTT